MTTLISCCNEALSQIAAGQIASLTEGSIEARECNRFAGTLLDEIGDSFDWPFAKSRAVLAQIPNDRAAEWLFAYKPPVDLGSPLFVRKQESDAEHLPIAGPDNFPLQDGLTLAFTYEGGVIYTNVEFATLAYVSGHMNLATMPALVRRYFVLELASRICLAVKKNAQTAMALSQQAEQARARAMEREANKQPEKQVRYISDAEWARMGVET
jgi:hypothetical protein